MAFSRPSRSWVVAAATLLVLACLTSTAAGSSDISSLANSSGVGLQIKTSWVGNSYPGGATGYVQQNCNAAWVAPDGRVICNAWWDEGGREGGVYQNGRVVGSLFETHHYSGGYAVVGDARYVYFAANRVNPGGLGLPSGRGVSRYSLADYSAAPFTGGGSHLGNFRPTRSGGAVTGLALLAGNLYVAVKDTNLVEVYRASDMVYLRQFPLAGPTAMAADTAGHLWIATQGDVRGYDGSGRYLGLNIADPVTPTALAIDGAGRLLIGDDGAGRQQVYRYNVSAGPPSLTETVGVAGGMYAGPRPGAAGPLRFNGIVGVGTDKTGQLYVVQDHPTSESAGTGTNIDVYRRAGQGWVRSWQLLGLMFVDLLDVDVASYRNGVMDAYTADEHLTLDVTRPPGQQWHWVGQLTDRFRYPADRRLLPLGDGQQFVARVLRLGGRLFLAVTGTYSDAVAVYRFDPGSERTVLVARLFNAYRNSSFDSHGNIWWTVAEGVSEQSFAGVDANGVPHWRPEGVLTRPAPFARVGRARYDGARDVMYVAGFTPERPSWVGSDKVMGTVLARYDRWSQGNRSPTWQRVLPYNSSVSLGAGIGLVAMDIDGDGRVYASMLDQRPGEGQTRVFAYDQGDGHLLASWVPGGAFGSTGWVDLVDGIRAVTLPTGRTLVFQEEDYHAKILMYEVASSASLRAAR